MEDHQGLKPHHLLLLGALLALTSCAEGETLPENFYDRPLHLTAITPDPETGPVARNQTFRLALNTYLDPEPLTYYNTLTLRSGAIRTSSLTYYNMVDKELVLRTRRNMEPNLFHDLGINPDVLLSVTGQPYDGALQFTYTVGDFLYDEPDLPAEPSPTWADVENIFAPCNTCHEDPEWLLPPMTYEGLVGQPSRQNPELLLVRRGDAPASYLMHKILWDYPLREGTAQPPPWANYDQLTRDQQRTLEAWIRGGAKP